MKPKELVTPSAVAPVPLLLGQGRPEQLKASVHTLYRCVSGESVDTCLLRQRLLDGRRNVHKFDERNPGLYPFAF